MADLQQLQSRLDKVINSLKGGEVKPQETARMVKRTEVASAQHKRNLVKYMIIGIAIILLLVGIVYFMAKTSHGQNIGDKLKSLLPFGSKKPPKPSNKRKLEAQTIDFRTPPSGGPSSGPIEGPVGLQKRLRQDGLRQDGPPIGLQPSTKHIPPVVLPNLPPNPEPHVFDPRAVPINRHPGNQPGPPRGPPMGPTPGPPMGPTPGPPMGPPMPPPNQQRGPSPPVDDV